MMNSFKSDSSAAFSNDDDRFDQVSIMLHWLTVVLIVAQFSSIWLREVIDHQSALAALLLAVHRTSGVFSWFVVAARIAWRRWCAHLPPFPASMPRIQQLACEGERVWSLHSAFGDADHRTSSSCIPWATF